MEKELGGARHRGMLARLSDELVAEIAESAERIAYPAGSIGFCWDEEPKAAILLTGSARTYLIAPDGTQVTIRFLAAGDLTGMYAPRVPKLTRAMQALDPTELLIISAGQLQALAESHPALAWALIDELTTVLNAAHRALYVRAVASARQRVAITLVDRSLASYGCLEPGCHIDATQQALAVWTGTAREVITLVLGSLQKEGILEIHRGVVVITDPDRLQREATEGLGLEGIR